MRKGSLPEPEMTLKDLVGDTGFEPVTSSVSRKRAPTAPIARMCPVSGSRWRRDLNPCTRLCRPLPRLSATPPRRPPSGRRDSNPRPSPWQGDALPTALRPHCHPVQPVTDGNSSLGLHPVPNRLPLRRAEAPPLHGKPAHDGAAARPAHPRSPANLAFNRSPASPVNGIGCPVV